MLSSGGSVRNFRSCRSFRLAICCHLGFVVHNNIVRVVVVVVVKVVGKVDVVVGVNILDKR